MDRETREKLVELKYGKLGNGFAALVIICGWFLTIVVLRILVELEVPLGYPDFWIWLWKEAS